MASDWPEVRAAVRALLGEEPAEIVLLGGGGNNRVARVTLAHRTVLAKHYSDDPNDGRDRGGTEHRLLTFLAEGGVTSVPRPLGLDPARRVGLYEWIEGCVPRDEDVGPAEVDALAQLLEDMAALRSRPEAAQLPDASDSAFSLAGHLQRVRERLERVRRGLGGGAGEAREHLEHSLTPAFLRLERVFAEFGEPAGASALARTLSPADHGFGNALRRPDGRIAFIDFEYAGWDDPAQVVANPCLRADGAVPPVLARRFAERLGLSLGGDAAAFAARLGLMLPLAALKWALILLNEFLSDATVRREFAGVDWGARRAGQIARSRDRVRVMHALLDDRERWWRALEALA